MGLYRGDYCFRPGSCPVLFSDPGGAAGFALLQTATAVLHGQNRRRPPCGRSRYSFTAAQPGNCASENLAKDCPSRSTDLDNDAAATAAGQRQERDRVEYQPFTDPNTR